MYQSISRLPKIIARTGLSRSTIYASVKNGTFPAPVPLGARSVGWLDSAIEKWIEERIAATPAKNGGAK